MPTGTIGSKGKIMGTFWRKVENKCLKCNAAVAKMAIKNGKIVVDEYYDNWGCWQKVADKSEMKTMCRSCQKIVVKKRNKKKRQRQQQRQRQNPPV